MLRVTKMYPFENLREALVTFFEKDISINCIKGIYCKLPLLRDDFIFAKGKNREVKNREDLVT